MKKKFIALSLMLILTANLIVACGSKSPAELAQATVSDNEESILQVSIVHPEKKDINITGEFVGSLVYDDEVNVFPLISGEITNTYFEEGDYVEAGQLMFTLDDSAYQLQLQNANKTYESAENGLTQQLGALEMQRNNAINSLHSAQEGIRQIEDSSAYFDEQKRDLDKSKADLQANRDEKKQDLLDLRRDRDDAEAEKHDLEDEVEELQKKLIAATPGTATYTSLNLKLQDKSTRVAELKQKIAVFDQTEPTLEAAIKQYDSSMDQLDSSKEGVQFQQDNLDYSMAQAKRGEILAQNNLDYFDTYTDPLTRRSAEISLDQAQIGINSAYLQLSNTRISAPVSGNVILKNNDVNDIAQAGYPVYVLLPEETYYASFNVPENVWRQLNIGDKVTVKKDSNLLDAVVSEIPTDINQQTGMFTIKAKINGSGDNLVTGTSVIVEATISSVQDKVTIPIDCVYYEAGKSYTYAVSSDGIISKVYIETGSYDGESMEIISGVTEDMMIITSWSSDYHDGLKVKIAED